MLKTENEETVKSKSKLSVTDLDFKKQSGLLPVIAQDQNTGAVLMLAYANLEAVKKTQESGYMFMIIVEHYIVFLKMVKMEIAIM